MGFSYCGPYIGFGHLQLETIPTRILSPLTSIYKDGCYKLMRLGRGLLGICFSRTRLPVPSENDKRIKKLTSLLSPLPPIHHI